MTNDKDGATVVPQHQPTDTAPECMGRWKHAWKWRWVNGVWTNKMFCPTCGAEREAQDTGQ